LYNKSVSLIIFTTNCTINLPTVISYRNINVAAERAENRVERSGERALHKNYGAERGVGGGRAGTVAYMGKG